MLYSNYLRDKSQNAIKIGQSEGYPCILKHSKGKYLKDYEIYGNSMQDGTPTPETPVEVQSVGELTTNNLLNMDAYIIKTNHQIDSTTGDLVYCGATRYAIETFIEVEPNTAYVISGKWLSKQYAGVTLFSYDNSKNYISPISFKRYFKNDLYYITFTTPDNCKYIRFYYENIENLQLEIGDTPTEYEPYGKYKIPVTVSGSGSGKNLFDENTVTADKYITVGGILKDSIYSNVSGYIAVKANQTYCLNYSYETLNSNNSREICVFDYDKNYINSIVYNPINNPIKITPTKDGYIRFTYDKNCKNLQIEEGISAAEYEPYVKPTITHIYLNEPLRKVGDYADYIDFKNQKIVRNINSMLIKASGPLKNNETDETAGFYFWIYDRMIINDSTNIQVLSPSLPSVPRASLSKDTSLITTSVDTNAIAFKLSKTLIGGDTMSLVNKYLKNNPITVYYILATPTEEAITVPTLKTVKGTSVISVDTSMEPSNIKAKYIRT